MNTKRNIFAFVVVVVIAISIFFVGFDISDTDRLFDKISDDTDFSYVQEVLKEKGFVSHIGFEKIIEDTDNLELQKEQLNELLADGGTIVYTKPENGFISFFNRCIVISPSEDGKVKYKRIRNSFLSSGEKEDIEAAKITFEKLTPGYDKNTVIKMMEKVAEVSSRSVEYNKDTVIEKYEFNVFSDISFLSLIHRTYFSSTVIFVNGILSDGNYTCVTDSNSETEDTDDVIRTEYKYNINTKINF